MGMKQIKIINTLGQVVTEYETLDNNIELHYNTLSPGIYDALILSGDKKGNVKFVVIKY